MWPTHQIVTQIVVAMIDKVTKVTMAESEVDVICKVYEKIYDCVQKCDHKSRPGPVSKPEGY